MKSEPGEIYLCNLCDYRHKHRSHLMNHLKAKHGTDILPECAMFACDHCDFRAKQKNILSNHIKSNNHVTKKVHECEQCHKIYSGEGALYLHKKSVHEGVKHASKECNYQSKFKFDLNKLILSKHEGVRYACDQCDYKATQQYHLRSHLKRKHGV